MTNYNEDRQFTDYIHNKIAVPKIYSQLKWNPKPIEDESLHNYRDINDAIDYEALDNNKETVTIQERFREVKYRNYNDFTIRYTRNNNSHEERKKSEFFKIDADFFLYGITNGTKNHQETITDFDKYIVFRVNKLKELINSDVIVVGDLNTNSKIINNGKQLQVSYKSNVDSSSEFIAIDPKQLIKVIGIDEINKLVILQKGYY